MLPASDDPCTVSGDREAGARRSHHHAGAALLPDELAEAPHVRLAAQVQLGVQANIPAMAVEAVPRKSAGHASLAAPEVQVARLLHRRGGGGAGTRSRSTASSSEAH
eukprot:2374921-Alexandrium_andersonii.AAC.1